MRISSRLVLLGAVLPSLASAQSAIADAVSRWIRWDAPVGHEVEAARALQRHLPEWTADRSGNLLRTVGSGSPRRVVACALDYSTYVVSQITEKGYIRLRRTGGNPPHPLWDQMHEAQRIKVITPDRTVPGVVAVANGHFSRQHRGDTLVVTVDQLWVDVGASSPGEVERLGISLLDPVVADRPAWTFEGNASGPAAGQRAGCAAVATAAEGRVAAGETTFILSTQATFGGVGLGAALTRLGKIDALTVVEAGRVTGGDGGGTGSPSRLASTTYRAMARVVKLDSVRIVTPRVRWPGTLVETIHESDASEVLNAVARAAGVPTANGPWASLPMDTARVLVARSDAYGELERQFMTLADLPAVPKHEFRVRAAVLAALPTWARDRAVVDSAGNVVLGMGPDRDSVAFIAHMDEVAFEIERMGSNGMLTLSPRGGAVTTAWEGTPALLHFDPGADGRAREPLRGVIVARDSARLKAPGALTAWFGLDLEQLTARGVKPGMGITSYKRAARLAGFRVTARATDDRAGSAALLAALLRIDATKLTHKVIFVWSVQEEGGLNGARAFGDQHGAFLQRVYSVDTFVSSDTPLESPHFAWAPLGNGAVLRGLDDASMPPREERNRVIAVAKANAIPLQVGTTHGGTDGSSIAPWGPPNIGLSWPGRYSHSPAEVLDLRDVDALSRLVAALAMSR